MLLSNKPGEITGFSNTIFLEELRIYCPVVYHFVLSACGIQESDVKVKGTAEASCLLFWGPRGNFWRVLLRQKQKAAGIFGSRCLFGPKSPSKRPPWFDRSQYFTMDKLQGQYGRRLQVPRVEKSSYFQILWGEQQVNLLQWIVGDSGSHQIGTNLWSTPVK